MQGSWLFYREIYKAHQGIVSLERHHSISHCSALSRKSSSKAITCSGWTCSRVSCRVWKHSLANESCSCYGCCWWGINLPLPVVGALSPHLVITSQRKAMSCTKDTQHLQKQHYLLSCVEASRSSKRFPSELSWNFMAFWVNKVEKNDFINLFIERPCLYDI